MYSTNNPQNNMRKQDQNSCHSPNSPYDKPSYADFRKCKEIEACDPDECIKKLMCYQAWMCKCDAEVYCETTARLSYELCMAKNLCEVKEIIESISCLFSASALKESALSDLIKSYALLCKKHIHPMCDCKCDC